MSIFISILAGLICFLFGFYYAVWFIKRNYLDMAKNLIFALDSDDYSLDFLTGAGVTLNAVFDNKLDGNVKLALTKKILNKRNRRPADEKH